MRPPVSSEIRQAIFDAYMDGETRPTAILEQLQKRFPENQLPVERTVYRIIAEARGKYSEEQRALDQPWLFGTELAKGAEGIDRDALPVLLDLLKLSLIEPALYSPPTIRMARWASVLMPALKDAGTTWVAHAALIYARRERWAAIEGEELDTSDLDAWLSFTTWRSNQDLQFYNRAVEKGLAPPMTTETAIRDLFPGEPGKVQEKLERLEAGRRRFMKREQGLEEEDAR